MGKTKSAGSKAVNFVGSQQGTAVGVYKPSSIAQEGERPTKKVKVTTDEPITTLKVTDAELQRILTAQEKNHKEETSEQEEEEEAQKEQETEKQMVKAKKNGKRKRHDSDDEYEQCTSSEDEELEDEDDMADLKAAKVVAPQVVCKKLSRKQEQKIVSKKVAKDSQAVEDALEKKGIQIDASAQDKKTTKKNKKASNGKNTAPEESTTKVFAQDLVTFQTLLAQFRETIQHSRHQTVKEESIAANATENIKHKVTTVKQEQKKRLTQKETKIVTNSVSVAYPRDVRFAVPMEPTFLDDERIGVIGRCVLEYFMQYVEQMQAQPQRQDLHLHWQGIKSTLRKGYVDVTKESFLSEQIRIANKNGNFVDRVVEADAQVHGWDQETKTKAKAIKEQLMIELFTKKTAKKDAKLEATE